MTEESKDKNVETLLHEGLELLDGGDYESALARWNEVLELDPSNERAGRLVSDLRALMSDSDDVDLSVSADYVVVLDEGGASDGDEGDDGGFRRTPSLITRTSLSRLQALIDRQVDENRELNETIAKHYREILELRGQLTDREQQGLDQRKRILALETQVAALDDDRRDLDRMRKEHERMQAHYELKLVEQKKFRDQMDQRVAGLEASLAGIGSELETATTSLETTRGELASLTTTHEQTRAELENEQTEHEATRALLDDASGRAEALEGEVATLDKQVDLAKGEIAALRKTLENERVDLEAAKDELRDVRTRLKLAEQGRTRAEHEVETRDEQLNEQRARLEALAAQLETATTERATLGADLETRTTERDDARAAAEAAQATITQLEGELAAMADARDGASTRADEAAAALAATTEARDALEQQLDEALTTAETLRQQLDAHAAADAEHEAKLTALEVERDQLRHDHQAARELAESRDAVIDTLRAELAQRDERLAEITLEYKRRSSDDYRIATEEAERLRTELEAAKAALADQLANAEARDAALEVSQTRADEANDALADALAERDAAMIERDAAIVEWDAAEARASDAESAAAAQPTGPPPAPTLPPHETEMPVSQNERPTGAWETVAQNSMPFEAVAETVEEEVPTFQLDDKLVPDTYEEGLSSDDDAPVFELESTERGGTETMAGMSFSLEEHLEVGERATDPAGNDVAFDREAIRERLAGHMTEAPRQVGVKLENVDGIGQREAFLLGSVDGMTTYAEIVDQAPLTEDDGMEALITLIEKGVIVSPSMRSGDPVHA